RTTIVALCTVPSGSASVVVMVKCPTVSFSAIVIDEGTLATDDALPGFGNRPVPGSSAATPTIVLTGTGSTSVTVPRLVSPAVTVVGIRAKDCTMPATIFDL